MTVQNEPNLFGLTESAAKRISFLLEQEAGDKTVLRVWVTGGGCSGFQYHFDFDSEIKGEDLVIERDGAKVVVDDVSLELLKGGELDFVEDLMGAYFKIENPNASSSCGCGVSFAI